MGTSHCTPWKINMEPEKSPVWKRKITFQTFIFTFHVYFHWCVPSIAHVFFSKEASCFPPFFERRHPIEVMNSTWAFAKLTYADSELMVRCPGSLDESCNPSGSKCRGQPFFFFRGKKTDPWNQAALQIHPICSKTLHKTGCLLRRCPVLAAMYVTLSWRPPGRWVFRTVVAVRDDGHLWELTAADYCCDLVVTGSSW